MNPHPSRSISNWAAFRTLILSCLWLTLPVIAAPVRAQEPVVRAVLFWKSGCGNCAETTNEVLPPIQQKYGAQFELRLVEVITMQDVDMLYAIASAYDIPKEEVGVPFLILGETVLIGSEQIRQQLPILLDDSLARGGVDWPDNPILAAYLSASPPASVPTSGLPAVTGTPPLADTVPTTPAHMQSNGFALAIAIMIGMVLVLLYSVIAFALGKAFIVPKWGNWLIPIFVVIGIGVAAYLSYVETQSVEAICGPVGDCNTVQQSRYATLLGFLPVGVLGLFGYLGMLAAWMTRRVFPKFAKPADVAFFAMAFFAVIFSLYLTYLEPFVIGAVCIWCLTSAVIVTLLLLLGTSPAVLQFTISNEDA